MQQQINFQPYLVDESSAELSADQILIAAAVALGLMLVVLLLLLVWNASLERRVATASDRHQQLTDEIAALGQSLSVSGGQSLSDLKRDVAVRRALLANLNDDKADDRISFSARLAGLGNSAVDGLWLNTIEIDATGKHLKLGGKTIRAELVPRYLSALSGDSVFQGLHFDMMTIQAERSSAETTSSQPLSFEVYALPNVTQGGEDG